MRRLSRSWHVGGLVSGSLLSALLASEAHGQFPPPLPPRGPVPPPPMAMPQPKLPPLMYVRLAGPKGMKATFFRGGERGHTVDTPAVIGLRPGYTYRVLLWGMAELPLQTFSPTLEVRGTMVLTGHLRNADFPATLNFTAEDFAKVREGAMLQKVILVERPDTAIPQATKAEEPIEINVPNVRDPVREAQERGQPLVLMQMGGREFAPEELARGGIPGTVLLPGEKVLPPPRLPPRMPFGLFPVHDPMLGPIPAEAYCILPDGGDVGLQAGIGPDGRLVGLDPSDTVAEYTDSKGRRKLSASNRVCLCVPRYLITRSEVGLGTQVALLAPGATRHIHGLEVFGIKHGLVGQHQRVGLELAAQRQRPSGTVNVYGTDIIGRIEGLEIKTSLRAVENVDGLCLRPEGPPAPDRPLLIIKWPDKMGAMIGDVVTFTLRYTNQGGQPIADVVVTDSLTPRFEYVAGSAKTDREAIFTTQPNEAGSTILRWQFAGVLRPRESGTITFQVRVR